jgi:lipoate-protein ligase A
VLDDREELPRDPLKTGTEKTMTRKGTSRVLDTGAGFPHWNMALDEALLDAHRPGELTLRLYAWQPHALSLGYFQPASEARQVLDAVPGLVLTRRRTGGGAILHADELTYSLVADAPQGTGSSRRLYTLMNRAIVEALAAKGVGATERGGGAGALGHAFLCFERHADFDVTVGTNKIAGSAQARKGSALLQHGSILLGPPPLGGEGLTSASAEAGKPLTYSELAPLLIDAARRAFEVPFPSERLSESLRERADALAAEKYGTEAWICKR